MKSGVVRFWLGLLLLTLVGYTAYSFARLQMRQSQTESGNSAPVSLPEKGHQVSKFELTERSGEAFDSASLDGQVWVASFFFSRCAGACVRMNNAVAGLQSELAELPVRFVSITVDPEHDTPQQLREYSQHYQAKPDRWMFLTGDQTTIERVAVEDFRVAYAREVHSDRLILVDREGKIFGYYASSEPAQLDKLKRDIKKLCEAGS